MSVLIIIIIIIIIEGLSLLQSIPPTTASKQTQAQKNGGAWLENCYEPIRLKLKLSRLVSKSIIININIRSSFLFRF